MRVVSFARYFGKHRIVGGDTGGHECVGGMDARDPLQSELFDEAVLHRQLSSLDAPLCRRRCGADSVDVEFVQRARELRVAVAAGRGNLIYAENARFVTVERQRLTALLDISSRSLEVSKRRLGAVE